MDTWKKIVISYYMVLVSTTFTVVVLDGLGEIDFTEGHFTLIITIFSVALAPVAISALKTKDFWKDDPESVSSAKKRYSEKESELRKEHSKICETYQDTIRTNNETISKHKEANLNLLAKQKFGKRRPTTKPERKI